MLLWRETFDDDYEAYVENLQLLADAKDSITTEKTFNIWSGQPKASEKRIWRAGLCSLSSSAFYLSLRVVNSFSHKN